MKEILSRILTKLFGRKYYYIVYSFVLKNEGNYVPGGTGNCTVSCTRGYRLDLTHVTNWIYKECGEISSRTEVNLLNIRRIDKEDFKTVCKKEGNNESMDKQQS